MRKQRFDRETWRADLPGWCATHLGARPERVLFESGWQSAVLGLHLDDGRDVVVKIRLAEPRVTACDLVHRYAHARGFPCPEPLIAPTPLGRYIATAEGYDPQGEELPTSDERTRQFAALLARLIREMPRVTDVPSLAPPPDWAAWDHAGPGLWPLAAEGHVDLNAHREEPWLADTVARARHRLARASLPLVIGHVDWESKHLLWRDGEIHVVHDWDSACALPEAAIAGLAASMFETTQTKAAATLDETEAFLGAYAAARAHNWTTEESQVAWAATLWVMAYDAKGEALDGWATRGTSLLLAERDERLRRAGA